MKTRSNRVKENTRGENGHSTVPGNVAFLLVVVGLLINAVVCLFINPALVFTISNIVGVFSIVALLTGNKVLVTISASAASMYFVVSLVEMYHLAWLAIVFLVIAFYWRNISPIGLIFSVTFLVVYAIVFAIVFHDPLYLIVIQLSPLHFAVAFTMAAFLKVHYRLPWI